MKLTETREGRTKLLVPEDSLERAEPRTVPVFFNPAASLNRDVSIAVTQASEGRSFCDALCGVGARGVRVAREVTRRVEVALVDFNAEALSLARRTARLNGVSSRCSFLHEGANAFLDSRLRRDEKFDYVDVDPFGTPAPYLQAAFSAVSDGGIVSVTATDTAVLCGVYPKVAARRYWATSLNNSFHHETAARILANACRRVAGSLDLGVELVAAHSTRHYVRLFVRTRVGARRADESMMFEGYVSHCGSCGHIVVSEEKRRSCVRCGGKSRTAGPLWLGGLVDETLVRSASEVCAKRGLGAASGLLRSLLGVDRFPPYSFSLEEVCSSLKVASVSPAAVEAALRSEGFRTRGQPLEKTGLKTDAEYADVVAAVREVSRQPRGEPRQPSQ